MAAMAVRALTTVRSTAASGSLVYEGQRAVDEYLQMHYGKPAEVFPYGDTGSLEPGSLLDTSLSFPRLCGKKLAEALSQAAGDQASALDVGCAVGGATFELSRHFGVVHGVDFSSAFVEAAQTMQRDGEMEYSSLVEGGAVAARVAQVPEGARGELCTFVQGDACAMEAQRGAPLLEGGYDAVLASNLLCRLPRPRSFLRSCSEWVVKPGGTLLLVSPYSWLEEYTAREEWIGGGAEGSERSSSVLEQEMLGLGFALRSRGNMPFLIREHARKFQLGVSEVTCWVNESS